MAAAVDEVVAQQVAIGIDVVSDGETSKIGYATYIKDRLVGFRRPLSAPAASRSRAASAVPRGHGAHDRRAVVSAGGLRRPGRARRPRSAAEGACESARCGRAARCARGVHERGLARRGLVVSVESAITRATRLTSMRSPTAMQPEYEAIVEAGFVLQLDCPDLAMARHTGFQELGRGRISRARRIPGRGAQSRRREDPGRVDAHAHMLGQLRGSARSRHRPREDSRYRAAGEAGRRSCSKPRIRGTATSGRCGATRRCPRTRS